MTETHEPNRSVKSQALTCSSSAVVGSSGREQTALAVQKARTAAKNHHLATIKETVSRQSGLVSAKLGQTSAA